MSAQASPSEFKQFIITSSGKNKKELDVIKTSAISITNIYFYENLLSPYITGVVTLVSTGSVEGVGEKGILGNAKQLPIEAGSLIRMQVRSGTTLGPVLNFSSEEDVYKKLIVNEVQVLDRKSSKEVVQIRFTSIVGTKNETVKIGNKLDGKISSIVEDVILKEKFKMKEDDYEVDETMNSVSMNGMNKTPFSMLGVLARQSIPATNKGKANPGYFFYQTKSGFKFKSISSIVSSKPFPKTYHYNGKTPDVDSVENLFKVARFEILRDQDLIKQIESGVYSSKNFFFNPAEYKFTEIDISVGDEKLIKDKDFTPLGKKDEITTPEVVELDIKDGQLSHRIQTAVMSVKPLSDDGMVNKDDPESIENNPEFWYAAGSTRYNILFSQKIAITVPCNTALEVGMKINLETENVAYCSGIDGVDERTSGQYIIQALCHYFDDSRSVTSLELIRDSYGTSDSFSADGSGDVSDSFLMGGSFGDKVTDKQSTRGFMQWKSSVDYLTGDLLGGAFRTALDNMGD